MAEIQDGRQNGDWMYFSVYKWQLNAYMLRNMDCNVSFPIDIESRKPNLPKSVTSENPIWRKSKMAAKMAPEIDFWALKRLY